MEHVMHKDPKPAFRYVERDQLLKKIEIYSRPDATLTMGATAFLAGDSLKEKAEWLKERNKKVDPVTGAFSPEEVAQISAARMTSRLADMGGKLEQSLPKKLRARAVTGSTAKPNSHPQAPHLQSGEILRFEVMSKGRRYMFSLEGANFIATPAVQNGRKHFANPVIKDWKLAPDEMLTMFGVELDAANRVIGAAPGTQKGVAFVTTNKAEIADIGRIADMCCQSIGVDRVAALKAEAGVVAKAGPAWLQPRTASKTAAPAPAAKPTQQAQAQTRQPPAPMPAPSKRATAQSATISQPSRAAMMADHERQQRIRHSQGYAPAMGM